MKHKNNKLCRQNIFSSSAFHSYISRFFHISDPIKKRDIQVFFLDGKLKYLNYKINIECKDSNLEIQGPKIKSRAKT